MNNHYWVRGVIYIGESNSTADFKDTGFMCGSHMIKQTVVRVVENLLGFTTEEYHHLISKMDITVVPFSSSEEDMYDSIVEAVEK